MSATEPKSNVLKFPVDDDEVEFCVPDGIADAENLLPIFLHDDAIGYMSTGGSGHVLVYEGVRGRDGEMHAVRLQDGEIIVRRLVGLGVDRVRLEAEHPGYESFEFFESQIEIIGVVVRNCLECTDCQRGAKSHVRTHVEMVDPLARAVGRVGPTPCVPTNIWSAAGTDIPKFIARPVMTWQMSVDGVVTSADRRCCEFLGLTEDEMRAGVWRKRLHPDDRAAYLRSRDQAIAEEVVFRNSVRILNATGEYCMVSVILFPFYEDGILKAWFAAAELEEERRKHSA